MLQMCEECAHRTGSSPQRKLQLLGNVWVRESKGSPKCQAMVCPSQGHRKLSCFTNREREAEF